MPGKLVLAAAVVMAPVYAVILLVTLLTATASGTAPAGDICSTSGPIRGLRRAQAENARTIAAVATPRGGRQAVLIAEVTALTESDMLVLGNPHDPTATGMPVQGIGHNYDSLGLFQQRPSWGGAAARLDPVTSTNLFLDALFDVQSWSSLQPWVAAQRVQRSAFTGVPSAGNGNSAVVGGNYRSRIAEAVSITASIERSTSALDCGEGPGTPPPGSKGAFGLPVIYRIPAGTSTSARLAVLFALAQRGKPYVWGADGPDAYDCSGLVHAAWAAAGVAVTHYTGAEVHEGTPTTPRQLRPGDLVLVPGSDGTLADPGHVGMYIGEGLVVHSPEPGQVVDVVTYESFTARGVSAVRHIA